MCTELDVKNLENAARKRYEDANIDLVQHNMNIASDHARSLASINTHLHAEIRDLRAKLRALEQPKIAKFDPTDQFDNKIVSKMLATLNQLIDVVNKLDKE